MPFYNTNSWKMAQKADKDLNRVYSHLSSGTRSGKKEEKIKSCATILSSCLNFRQRCFSSQEKQFIW